MSAFWHAVLSYYKPCMPTNWTRKTPSPLSSSVKHYFKACFFHTSQLSPSGEWVNLKTLIFDSEISVKCNNQTLMHRNIRQIFLVTVTLVNLGVLIHNSHISYFSVFKSVGFIQNFAVIMENAVIHICIQSEILRKQKF